MRIHPETLKPVALPLLLVLLAASCATPKQPVFCRSVKGISGPAIGFTTVERTILPVSRLKILPPGVPSHDVYRTLEACAPWRRVTRTDITDRSPAGAEGGTPLLSLVHLSDIHIVDAESPLRVEFLRHHRGLFLPGDEFQAGFRSQETLTTQVTESMMRQLNALEKGPVTGRKFELAVVTGDSGDNHQINELEHFIALLNGGKQIWPGSGSAKYQGVQDLDSSPIFCEFWHPQRPTRSTDCGDQRGARCGPDCEDKWKAIGFPSDYPNLLEDALKSFHTTGLNLSWYTAYGNHDELVQGNFPIRARLEPMGALSGLATGKRKLIELPVDGVFPQIDTDEFVLELLNPLDFGSDWRRIVSQWKGDDAREVEHDPGRRLWTRRGYVKALNDKDNKGPYGPQGHGLAHVPADGERLYYAFDLNDAIRGIVLDTTNPNGLSGGSLDGEQLLWLEAELKQVHGVYYSHYGRPIQQPGTQDRLVVLFSHHNTQTLDNLIPSLDPLVLRVGAGHIQRVLFRYPNVVLWLNGHTHYAKILAHPSPWLEGQGFWEVTTPSLIDFPQMSRAIELRDNLDGKLSIFATLIDHAAPPSPAEAGDDQVLRLASISRELTANDPLLTLAKQIGKPTDRNVELLIKAPYRLGSGGD